MGDRGIYMLLKTSRSGVKIQEGSPFLHDHSQITTEGLIEEYSRLGVVGGCELVFVASDIDIVERRVGVHGLRFVQLEALHRRGVIVTAGSDSPVERFNPSMASTQRSTAQRTVSRRG